MSCSSEGGASVPVSVVQEGHKLSVTGAEWEEGGGYSLHVEVSLKRRLPKITRSFTITQGLLLVEWDGRVG